MTTRKKLIEVALPLEAINKASAREAGARLTAWEVFHHLVRVPTSGGARGAAKLVAKLGAKAEIARELAYRLYTLCERKKRAAGALTARYLYLPRLVGPEVLV